MAEGIAQSFLTKNYSGMLFNKGNTRCPFSSLIGGRTRTTNSVEFPVGQSFTSEGNGSQPAISETASLTAPNPTYITREQQSNVTQIFHESFGVSYAKMSNMGTLSGLNIAGQTANPASELDFQAAARTMKINRDIEYTFINGAYAKASNDSTPNKTRGMLEAITTNTKALGNKPLTFWDIAELQQSIYEANAPATGLLLWVDGTTMMQLNADASANGLTIIPADRTINGIALSKVITPFGEIYLRLGECLPGGTAMLFNADVISPVYQPVPKKGNFFLEQLAKQGAGEVYQLFGQIGLDHGPEWYHGKITGIAQTFTKPTHSKSVKVDSSATNPVHTKAAT